MSYKIGCFKTTEAGLFCKYHIFHVLPSVIDDFSQHMYCSDFILWLASNIKINQDYSVGPQMSKRCFKGILLCVKYEVLKYEWIIN